MAVKGRRDRLTVQQPAVGLDGASGRRFAEQLQLGPFEEFRCTRDNADLCVLDRLCRNRGAIHGFHALLCFPF